MKGWIYIATNKSLVGLIKIGFTTKDPILRISDFNNAGIPHEHVLEYAALVDEPYRTEQKIHKTLSHLNENKEWFKCSIQDAINFIQSASEKIYFEEIHNKSLKNDESLNFFKNAIEPNQSSKKTPFYFNDELKMCDFSYYEKCPNEAFINYKGQFLCKIHHEKLRKKRFDKLRQE